VEFILWRETQKITIKAINVFLVAVNIMKKIKQGERIKSYLGGQGIAVNEGSFQGELPERERESWEDR
jgi:hypothetical protein